MIIRPVLAAALLALAACAGDAPDPGPGLASPPPAESGPAEDVAIVGARVCVAPDGRAAEVTLLRTSGSEAIDSAAIAWLRESPYAPRAEASCADLDIEWALPAPSSAPPRLETLLPATRGR